MLVGTARLLLRGWCQHPAAGEGPSVNRTSSGAPSSSSLLQEDNPFRIGTNCFDTTVFEGSAYVIFIILAVLIQCRCRRRPRTKPHSNRPHDQQRLLPQDEAIISRRQCSSVGPNPAAAASHNNISTALLSDVGRSECETRQVKLSLRRTDGCARLPLNSDDQRNSSTEFHSLACQCINTSAMCIALARGNRNPHQNKCARVSRACLLLASLFMPLSAITVLVYYLTHARTHAAAHTHRAGDHSEQQQLLLRKYEIVVLSLRVVAWLACLWWVHVALHALSQVHRMLTSAQRGDSNFIHEVESVGGSPRRRRMMMALPQHASALFGICCQKMYLQALVLVLWWWYMLAIAVWSVWTEVHDRRRRTIVSLRFIMKCADAVVIIGPCVSVAMISFLRAWQCRSRIRAQWRKYLIDQEGALQSEIFEENEYVLLWTVLVLAVRHKPKQSRLPVGERPSSGNDGYESAHCFSRLLFLWPMRLLRRATFVMRVSEHLATDDLEQLAGMDNVRVSYRLFMEKWKSDGIGMKTVRSKLRGCKQPKVAYPVILCLWKAFGKYYTLVGFMKLAADLVAFSGPVVLQYLIKFVSESSSHSEDASHAKTKGFVLAALLIAGQVLSAILSAQYQFGVNRCALRVRSALVMAIYCKVLMRLRGSSEEFSRGKVTNIMSVDIERCTNMCVSFHEMWSLPVQIAIALYLLYVQVGISLLGGLGVILLMIPVNWWLTKVIARVSNAMMSAKDVRMEVLDELIRNIRIVKMLTIESFFVDRVLDVRSKELSFLATRKYLDAWCVYFWATTPVLVSVACFGMYHELGHELTAARVFTALALFNILVRPLNAFPWVVNGLVEGLISMKRVRSFIVDDWIACAVSPILSSDAHMVDGKGLGVNVVLKMNNAHFIHGYDGARKRSADVYGGDIESLQGSYVPGPRIWKLGGINMSVCRGEYVGIVGSVGSGKSSLLLAVLGEMNHKSGFLYIQKGCKFSFVSQSPWLRNGTVRQNITLQMPGEDSCNVNFDDKRYKSVLRACALGPDLAMWPDSDGHEVGEGGVNLSGGQRMRVALARAVYADADVYLFDDPFGAVDVDVRAHILRNCVLGPLLKGKTRIVVTHHLGCLRDASKIVRMAGGHIDDVLTARHAIEALAGGEELKHLSTRIVSGQVSISGETTESKRSLEAERAGSARIDGSGDDSSSVLVAPKLTTSENRVQGTVRCKVVSVYLFYVGMTVCACVMLSFLMMQVTRNGGDWWLSQWTAAQLSDRSANTSSVSPLHGRGPSLGMKAIMGTNHSLDAADYLRIFMFIAVANSIFTLVRAFLFAFAGLRGARRIFHALLTQISMATVQFFDQNPVGRILNRFSLDQFAVDESITFQGNIFLAQCFGLVGAVGLITLMVPLFAVCLIPLGMAYIAIQQRYRAASRELRRLDSVSRSFMFSLFSESLMGAVQIRCFGAVPSFLQEGVNVLERSQRVVFSSLAVSSWLSFRLQMIGVAVSAFISIFVVVVSVQNGQHTSASASVVGLALAYALPLISTLSGLVNAFTETEREFISVERIAEYLNVDVEDASMFGRNAMAAKAVNRRGIVPTLSVESPVRRRWVIERGDVTFKGVSLTYPSNTRPALRDVSFACNAGESIGVVGRTGAGKSSLLSVLFRLYPFVGQVYIDGVDISTICLEDLRSQISIVPQHPTLFSGSLRDNLRLGADRSGERFADDDIIWGLLRRFGLEQKVKLIGGLDVSIGSAGEHGSDTVEQQCNYGMPPSGAGGSVNFSIGEKQMLCLARAVLARSRLIVLDEATAHADAAADTMVDALHLDRKATVFIIAHRLSSIMRCDHVLVMADAQIIEHGIPAQLVQDPMSYFSRMVASGNASASD